MKYLVIIFIASMILSCKGQTPLQDEGTSNLESHSPTEVLIRLESISKETSQLIRDLNEKDTSSYYVDTRPVIFQIVGIRNNSDETRYTLPINRSVEVMIYALGEAKNGKLVDYAWIENFSGDKIWEMKYENTEYAGGAPANRKVYESFTIPPGRYQLRYRSDASHAIGDWRGEAPEYAIGYGVTVYNIQAIELIKKEMGGELY